MSERRIVTEEEWNAVADFWWRAGIAAQSRAPVPTVDEGPQFTDLPLAPSPEDIRLVAEAVMDMYVSDKHEAAARRLLEVSGE